jgi:hypothetical protein
MSTTASNATAATAYWDLQRRGTPQSDLSHLRTQIYDMQNLSNQMSQSFMEYAMHENGMKAKDQAERDERRHRSHEIIFYLGTVKVLFRQVATFNGDLFKEDIPRLFEQISFECKCEADFHNGIDLLAKVFDVPLSPLQELVSNPNPCWKSINLIRAWLEQKGFENYQCIIDTWNNIIRLRKGESHDLVDEGVIDAYEFFGMVGRDFSCLWDNVLDTFLRSLKDFYKFTSDYPNIRHAGTPGSRLRDLKKDDALLAVTLALAFGLFVYDNNSGEATIQGEL